jgi:uncharacterized protein
MKYTLVITQKCNLACDYCYVGKNDSVMPLSTAKKIIDFIFDYSPKDEKINIGFFGGEPLLEFDLVKQITALIQKHEHFNPKNVNLMVVTNGTIFTEEIKDFLIDKHVGLGISCDGPSHVQDVFRHFPDGSGTSKVVERNIKKALHFFPFIPVNAVYSPENLHFLPEVLDYLLSLGVINIYLNPNISAHWTKKEADMLPQIYDAIGKRHLDFYLHEKPRYISLIDDKIIVILRGGYQPLERCRMGTAEFAFTPSGNVYPCERLIGSDDSQLHRIGNILDGFVLEKKCAKISNQVTTIECQSCGLNQYCMNWCGCTNYFSTGNYHLVGPFMCASEKAAINSAFQVLKEATAKGLNFSEHLTGTPLLSVIREVIKKKTN